MSVSSKAGVFTISCLLIVGKMLSQTLYWEKIFAYYRVFDIVYDGSEYLYFSSKDDNGNSKFLRSSDLGNTWELVGNGLSTNYLTKLAIDSSGTLWGGNEYFDFGLFKSTDHGMNWNLVMDSIVVSSLTISPTNIIWFGTDDGRIFFSTNQGINWEERIIGSSGISSITINSSNSVFATTGTSGEGGSIYRSTDLGNSWENVYNSSSSLGILLTIQHSTGYIYGFGTYTNLISTDNGNTWEENYRDLTFAENFYLVSDSIFYASGSNGLRSYDFENWNVIGPMDPNAPLAYAFVDSLIFAATVSGVFKYDPSIQPYIADTYFPLEIGNTWQYHSYCTRNNPMYYVDRDTTILNHKYYYLKGYYNDWVRYDTTENKLFVRYNDSDYVAMDFGLNNGSYFYLLLLNSHEIRLAQIIEPYQLSIFDSTYHSRGYFWRLTSGTAWIADEVSFSENLGETLSNYGSGGPGGTFFCDRKLIRAVLYDSTGIRYLSDKVKPLIYFDAQLVTDTLDINWQFVVDHEYSYYSSYINVNFIDTVYMVSYYSNGVDFIDNDTLGAINQPQSYNYTLSFSLDSALIKNDYNLYYKIVAVDAGVVQETSVKPDSGFFELIYDTSLVSVDEMDNSIDNYALYQNYPNPFNPTTIIKYQLPEISYVTLKVYDVLGNEISVLVNEEKPAGSYDIKFNADDLSSGIYFYQLTAKEKGGNYIETRKMILLR